MKSIVVYFSLEGNTKFVAEKITADIGADILKLEPVKDYHRGGISKYIWGGKSVIFGEIPKLMPYSFNVADYDVVIIGTPVWAGSFTPPIKTFIRDNNLTAKKIALFACHASGGAEKCFDKLKNEIGNCKVIAELDLDDPAKNQLEENNLKIDNFCAKIKSA